MLVLFNIKYNNEYKKSLIKLFKNYKIIILKYCICFLNFFILFINIYLIIKKIFIIFFPKFKNVDIFNLILSKKSYKEISHYLNDKYFINKNSDKIIKKEILIDCVDFLDNNNTCRNIISNIFQNNLEFRIDINKPDYLLYDVFGCQHLNPKYDNTIKIAYYSENILPDFSESDYALSQAHLTYLDRYFKYPSFILNLIYLSNYNNKKRKGIIKDTLRKKFCAAVISNNRSYAEFRLNFIQKLNKYKTVDMGGKTSNNIGKKVENKIDFLSDYKFSICMENSNGDGYASEKIIESLIAGTIPIYYGDYMIDEYINPKAFILIKGQKDVLPKIEYIKKIDNDNKLYRAILSEDIFLYNKNNKILEIIEEEKKSFLLNIFYQEKSLSKRIDTNNNNFKCLI